MESKPIYVGALAQMASLLDPRFKNLKFESSEQIKFRIQSIV